MAREPRYNLRPSSPDLSAFPRAAWLAAARRALAAAPSQALGYGDPRGRPELRRALAGYLSRARGVAVSPENIVVCAGFGHGLHVLSQVVAARGGTRVAMEAYSQAAHRDTVTAAGLAVTPVPVDGTARWWRSSGPRPRRCSPRRTSSRSGWRCTRDGGRRR
ncbi:MAG TPA: aminotransferase class I/II-fold pyridoxal phosphate-dependent enzyme [Streptosporangiaceae bacterium]|nr:aminotransferase class I/II-fold pyridoxal phosphate-dependent enzyme [Streptosporangiaceae bacterium]